LSRFVLGLDARFDRGPLNYALTLRPGSLSSAKGCVPLPNGQGVVSVHWHRADKGIAYQIETPVSIVLHLEPQQSPGMQTPVRVERSLNITLSL
jgi:hypothetical protein